MKNILSPKFFSISLAVPLLIFLFIMLHSCESELKPPPPPSVVSGKIIYKGGVNAWPDSSEVYAIRVALFKTEKPDGFFEAVINGEAYFNFLSYPLFVDEFEYSIEILDPPVELNYMVVSMQYNEILDSQRVISIYSKSNNFDEPSSLFVNPGTTFTNIDFYVDFDNLPNQPF